ncbi:MAG TPA: AI-2E family transporter [Pyrinomonadaceae bacterium]|jgi:predicted PurR-regulated permease PerM
MEQGGESKRLGDVTVGEAKRAAIYAAAIALALFLFVRLLGEVLVALMVGTVAGVYLLPVQEWLERRLHARAGSALITIALIVVPLAATIGYGWYEMSGYTAAVQDQAQREQVIAGISRSLSDFVPAEQTRAALEAGFGEAFVRSGEALAEVKERTALLLVSATVFFFTLFYVLTQRARLAAYIKLRVPGDFMPFYERLVENVGGALRGALFAVMVDQTLKAVVILVMNFVFGVPLAVALALITFLIGFFPLLGEWAVYIPVSVYLLVFQHRPGAAAAYLLIGVAMTAGSSLALRPKLAALSAQRFNFYWMFIGLVAGVYAFGIPGVILGPAILGFAKAITDTLVGEVKYETSLLKEERAQRTEEAKAETAKAVKSP